MTKHRARRLIGALLVLALTASAQAAPPAKTYSRLVPDVALRSRAAMVVRADTGAVLRNWDEIKRAEKGRTSVFDGVARSLPSLSYADAVQSKAAKVGFDWPDVSGAIPKITEELDELLAIHTGDDPAAIADELGDLLFAVVNVARHLRVEPEVALRVAADKFRRRFEDVERLADERGVDLRAADLEALDALWNDVKADEHR